MKNNIAFGIAISLLIIAPLSYADESEVKLKRSCIKDNPVVEGESDPTLLGIYAQLCDKKNKDNKDNNMILAAQQFQKMGKNYKALRIVSELESNNIHSNTLTDVKFLAGVNLANLALNQMRDKEVRYLSDDTYPPAKAFTEIVNKAMPAPIIVESKPKNDEEVKAKTYTTKTTKHYTNNSTGNKKNRTEPKIKKVTTNKSNVTAPPPATTKSGGNPFASLNN